jgi:hypothetical protein
MFSTASVVDNITAFPNPFYPSRDSLITVDNLPLADEILVCNLSGDVIKKLEYTPGNSRAFWDAKNSEGKIVASGVYFIAVKYGNTYKSVKVAIIK